MTIILGQALLSINPKSTQRQKKAREESKKEGLVGGGGEMTNVQFVP